jgi:hypothetical protein
MWANIARGMGKAGKMEEEEEIEEIGTAGTTGTAVKPGKWGKAGIRYSVFGECVLKLERACCLSNGGRSSEGYWKESPSNHQQVHR